jgi:hypothetical protein
VNLPKNPANLPLISRRGFLTTTGALSVSGLAACGAAKGLDPDPDIEGVDFFTVNARVLNLAAVAASVSISSVTTSLVSNLAYGTISPQITLVLDPPFTRDAGQTQATTSVTTTGPALSGSLVGLNVLQALYMVTSNVTNSVSSFAITPVGGVPGSYPSSALGGLPLSKIYLVTSAIASVNVFTQATPTSAVVAGGLLANNTAGRSIPNVISSNFRLTLKDAVSGASVYDSGLKTKDDATALFISRDAALSAGWTIFAVDKNFVVSRWANTI